MKKGNNILLITVLLLLQIAGFVNLSFANNKNVITCFNYTDTLPPAAPKRTIFKQLADYKDSLSKRSYRDSLLYKLSRENKQEGEPEDSVLVKREKIFESAEGKPIRRIIYRKTKVFGPSNINDTTFTTTNWLIKFANRMHFESQEWAIRQSLFFREHDIVDSYTMADNERYLRNLPFIQDARIQIVNTNDKDSVDVIVLTKDVFEYGVSISNATLTSFEGSVFNNDLLGAAQQLRVGFAWNKPYSPPFNSEIKYTKNNIFGSFMDVTVGYSTLNDSDPLDSAVYEKSYYLNLNRPLYRPSAKLAGGLKIALNSSMNIYSLNDTLFKNYSYYLGDVWLGYNFLTAISKTGNKYEKPSIALAVRSYNTNFRKRPTQPKYEDDPVFNDHSYVLSELSWFKQEYFQTRYLFGFGRTEDVPRGFKLSGSTGWEYWLNEQRLYTGLQFQRDWKTTNNGLFSIDAGLSSFWKAGNSEDAVIHSSFEYYSKLFQKGRKRFRNFGLVDYLYCPDPSLYKPLNINRENGIWGYRNTWLNGYQRLNVRNETTYYSPLKVYGFKFSFQVSLQMSLLAGAKESILKSPVYSSAGLACLIRNENLPLNTLKIAASVLPSPPVGVKPFFFELTTVSDIRFNIFPLKAPTFLNFK